MEIVRWVAVLPASLLGVLFVTFPIHWAVMLVGLTDSPDDAAITVDGKGLLASIDPQMLERFGDALFIPMVFLMAGAKVAPRFKFQTGIVQAILWGILLGAGIMMALTAGGFQWRILIALCLGAVGLGVGLKIAHNEATATAF